MSTTHASCFLGDGRHAMKRHAMRLVEGHEPFDLERLQVVASGVERRRQPTQLLGVDGGRSGRRPPWVSKSRPANTATTATKTETCRRAHEPSGAPLRPEGPAVERPLFAISVPRRPRVTNPGNRGSHPSLWLPVCTPPGPDDPGARAEVPPRRHREGLLSTPREGGRSWIGGCPLVQCHETGRRLGP
jgi:hypothetical protein